jgi:hypothetical protein
MTQETTIWPPPDWSTGTPPEPGVYIGWAANVARVRPELYEWTGQNWRHHRGWFDSHITHWIRLND